MPKRKAQIKDDKIAMVDLRFTDLPGLWQHFPVPPSALDGDHDLLLKGDVFTPDVVDTHLSYKRTREVDEMRLRPHPHEFFLYYDV